jgi:hypothetical protein
MIGDHKFAIQYGGSRLYFDSHLPGLGSRIAGAFSAPPSGIIRARQCSKAIMLDFIDPFAGVEPPLKGQTTNCPAGMREGLTRVPHRRGQPASTEIYSEFIVVSVCRPCELPLPVLGTLFSVLDVF